MFPLPLAGIAVAGPILLSKYSKKPASIKKKAHYTLSPKSKNTVIRRASAPNPIQSLVRGLSSTLSGISKRLAGEDYSSIIKTHIPPGAVLLKPQYPVNSKAFQLADIDGDTRNELIASYRQNDEVRTIILKKQGEQWKKLDEINNLKYDTLNYRNAVDVTGDGTKHLLIGMSAKGKTPQLYGYTLEKENARELFSRSYHRFELLQHTAGSSTVSRPRLAVWDRKEDEAYDVSLLHWNGSELEQFDGASNYFYQRVLPYYAGIVRQSPYAPSGWYSLADALVKAGLRRDAQIAIRVGMTQDKDGIYKEKFTALNDEIKKMS